MEALTVVAIITMPIVVLSMIVALCLNSAIFKRPTKLIFVAGLALAITLFIYCVKTECDLKNRDRVCEEIKGGVAIGGECYINGEKEDAQ